MMDSGPLLIALAIICFCLFFIRILMIAYRFYILRKLKEDEERHGQQWQARRQMEVSVANNNLNTDGPSSVRIETQNDMTILPKNMDLPPSYDELNYSQDVKQPGSLGASMLTINTNLECSNPNLAAALNEPPPDYIDTGASATTTTTTTTTVVVTGGLPRI